MEIKIDNQAIQDGVAGHIQEAVVKAVTGYGVQRAIENQIAEGATLEAVNKAVAASLYSLDIGTMTRSLAAEIQKAMTSAIVLVVRDAVAEMLMRLRKVPEHDEAARERARLQILKELEYEGMS